MGPKIANFFQENGPLLSLQQGKIICKYERWKLPLRFVLHANCHAFLVNYYAYIPRKCHTLMHSLIGNIFIATKHNSLLACNTYYKFKANVNLWGRRKNVIIHIFQVILWVFIFLANKMHKET